MRSEFNNIGGRVGVFAAVVLALAALALYFYSERAVPPETELEAPTDAESGDRFGRPDSFEATPLDEAPAAKPENGPAEADRDNPVSDEHVVPRPGEAETVDRKSVV